jgi:putative DNA primase/helicase
MSAFDDIVGGQFDDDKSRDYALLYRELEELALSDDPEPGEITTRAIEILACYAPPREEMAKQQVRGRLIGILRAKFREAMEFTSPAKFTDAWLAEHADEPAEKLRGHEFVADDTVCWGQPVDLDAVLDEVRVLFQAYVYASADALVALALWTVYTHAAHLFDVSSLLDLTSPTKRCGKTSTCNVLRFTIKSALLTGNISPASIYRAIDAWHPSLIIDEADTFAAAHDEIRGILNSGHTRTSAFVIRAEGEGNEPRMFSTFTPKVIAAIGSLPDTLEDRSIKIPLSRKPTNVTKLDAFDEKALRAVCEGVRRRIARAVADYDADLAEMEPERPEGLHDRAWNNWRPLLAVATFASDEWRQAAMRAAQALTGGNGDTEDLGELAIQHVYETVAAAANGRVATEDLLRELVKRDDAPWAAKWEQKIASGNAKQPAAALAKYLRRFGVKPRQLWIGEKIRGYDLEDFRSETVTAYVSQTAAEETVATVGTVDPASEAGSGPTVPAPRDGSDGRNTVGAEPCSHAGSTEPTDPTVNSKSPAKDDLCIVCEERPAAPGSIRCKACRRSAETDIKGEAA